MQLETNCYSDASYVHSCMKCLGHNLCDLRSSKCVYHGNVDPGIRSTELTLHSRKSDRYAPADEVGSAGLRLFACSVVELKRIH